jgi:ABC-type Fe3+-hydroxamate transport system substrate-binding protein
MAADDLGHPLRLTRPAQRVVSLVPSLTESIAATRPHALIGATDWCTHPPDLDIARVRGTKNPDLKAIAGLAPDLVLVNREENRQLDVERLRRTGIEVWVTVIETVPQALTSLRRMFVDALRWPVPSWLDEADAVWAEPAPKQDRSVAVPIWRDPWMVVGSHTFTGDLIERLGLANVYAENSQRYPQVDVADIRSDLVLLPDEPYVFTADDGPEAFPATPTVLVPGRLLTWYGPSLVTARAELTDRLTASG